MTLINGPFRTLEIANLAYFRLVLYWKSLQSKTISHPDLFSFKILAKIITQIDFSDETNAKMQQQIIRFLIDFYWLSIDLLVQSISNFGWKWIKMRSWWFGQKVKIGIGVAPSAGTFDFCTLWISGKRRQVYFDPRFDRSDQSAPILVVSSGNGLQNVTDHCDANPLPQCVCVYFNLHCVLQVCSITSRRRLVRIFTNIGS